MWLKHNCTIKEEFLVQAETLTKRFEEKGYSRDFLKNTLDEIIVMERRDLLKEKPPCEDRVPSVPFISTYSVQHMNVKTLLNKNWHILGNYQILNAVLSDKPQVIFP